MLPGGTAAGAQSQTSEGYLGFRIILSSKPKAAVRSLVVNVEAQALRSTERDLGVPPVTCWLGTVVTLSPLTLSSSTEQVDDSDAHRTVCRSHMR